MTLGLTCLSLMSAYWWKNYVFEFWKTSLNLRDNLERTPEAISKQNLFSRFQSCWTPIQKMNSEDKAFPKKFCVKESSKLIGLENFGVAGFSIVTICSYHFTYAFQSESTPYSCLNIKELLARNRRDVWSLSDYNGTRTQNHLVRKRTFNHLAKLAKWLSCVVNTYLYGVFDCMLLSCHVRVSEWIHFL